MFGETDLCSRIFQTRYIYRKPHAVVFSSFADLGIVYRRSGVTLPGWLYISSMLYVRVMSETTCERCNMGLFPFWATFLFDLLGCYASRKRPFFVVVDDEFSPGARHPSSSPVFFYDVFFRSVLYP